MATSRTKGAKNKKTSMRDRSLGGFTIIEVVLVLAIAGLIFMMVFIALPQLQRAQRDTQRRQDMADLQAAVTQYQSNNNGNIPDSGTFPVNTESLEDLNCAADNKACRLIKTYMNSVNATDNTFVDPDGTPYGLEISTADSVKSNYDFDHMIYMYTKAKCDGETAIPATNKRDFALVYRLEGSGTYCHDNNG